MVVVHPVCQRAGLQAWLKQWRKAKQARLSAKEHAGMSALMLARTLILVKFHWHLPHYILINWLHPMVVTCWHFGVSDHRAILDTWWHVEPTTTDIITGTITDITTNTKTTTTTLNTYMTRIKKIVMSVSHSCNVFYCTLTKLNDSTFPGDNVDDIISRGKDR